VLKTIYVVIDDLAGVFNNFCIFYIIVTWIKDNVPIGEDSSIYQFMQVGNKYRMKILRAGHDDIGQYVVEAKDSSGVQVAAAFSVNLSFLSE